MQLIPSKKKCWCASVARAPTLLSLVSFRPGQILYVSARPLGDRHHLSEVPGRSAAPLAKCSTGGGCSCCCCAGRIPFLAGHVVCRHSLSSEALGFHLGVVRLDCTACHSGTGSTFGQDAPQVPAQHVWQSSCSTSASSGIRRGPPHLLCMSRFWPLFSAA